jgi:hypothetical protein
MTRRSPDSAPGAGGQPPAATSVVCTGIDGAPKDRATHALTKLVRCTRVSERPSTIPTVASTTSRSRRERRRPR